MMSTASSAAPALGVPTGAATGSFVLGTSAAPMRPQKRIARGQAQYSTYASKMRAGTTTLMQPIARGAADGEGLLGPRSRSTVYYGEDDEDEDEDDDDEYVDSEEEELGASRQKRRRSDTHPSGSPETPSAVDVEAAAELAAPGAQLGLPVPQNRLVVRPAVRTPHNYFSDAQLWQQASSSEVLIPIRIEFHTETHRIKDVFMWNMNERLVTPYQFAQVFLQDLALPLHPYAVQIESLIIQQLADATAIVDVDNHGDSLSRIIDLKTSARERKRAEAEAESARRRMAMANTVSGSDGVSALAPRRRGRPRKYPRPEEAAPQPVDDTPLLVLPAVARESPPVLSASPAPGQDDVDDPKAMEKARIHETLASVDAEDDLRVIVEYEVQSVRHVLRDRLEWDLGSELTPEGFAQTLTRDLGLPLESGVLIAHAVHEQLMHHRRAALDLGLFGSGKIYKCTMDELVAVHRAEQAQAATLDEAPVDEFDEQRRAVEAAQAAEYDELPAGPRDESAPPNTRSRRIAGGISGSGAAADSSLSMPFIVPDKSLPLAMRRQQALATLRDLLTIGPRPLEGVWRDFTDAADFGPLLEYLSEAELEKMEEADARASRCVCLAMMTNHRRNRREVQRVGRSRR